jgi:hypothetical protein
MTDLLGGQVQVMIANVPPSLRKSGWEDFVNWL